jgi:proteasome accessory factor C
LPVEESLAVIQEALAEGQALEMDYYTAGRDELTHRLVEPYRLEQRGDVHYLVGFCHRAQAERVFRVDRIRSIVKAPMEG